MKKHLYPSPLGALAIIANRGKLIYCNWDNPECSHKQANIESRFIEETEYFEDKLVLEETCLQLEEYFKERRKYFDIPFELVGTEFQRKVWDSIYKVGYGETVSYKKLAEMASIPKTFQAVAQACGANPVSIIVPCHRIIASNGKLGGYTGGIDKKIALLNLENKIFQL